MIRQLDSEIWVIDHSDFKLGPGIRVGTRTTVIRLADGGLWVHSPGPLTEDLIQEINGLGPVRFLVAPNTFHHLFISENCTAWPSASLYVAPGLLEKRKDLSGALELDSDPDPGWSAEVDQCLIEGSPRLGEVVFRHRASRTLILTDWVFNVGRPQSLGARFFFTLTGVLGGVSVSRLIRFLTRDKAAARSSFGRVLQWDFNRIVMAHGDVIEQGGPRPLRGALTRIGMTSD